MNLNEDRIETLIHQRDLLVSELRKLLDLGRIVHIDQQLTAEELLSAIKLLKRRLESRPIQQVFSDRAQEFKHLVV